MIKKREVIIMAINFNKAVKGEKGWGLI